jgi:hypothetical protein
MTHAQEPDFVLRRNGQAHLNRWGRHSRLLTAEVCASAVVMLDTPCSVVVCRVLATHSIRQFSLHFPSRASPCAITFQLDSSILVQRLKWFTSLGRGKSFEKCLFQLYVAFEWCGSKLNRPTYFDVDTPVQNPQKTVVHIRTEWRAFKTHWLVHQQIDQLNYRQIDLMFDRPPMSQPLIHLSIH